MATQVSFAHEKSDVGIVSIWPSVGLQSSKMPSGIFSGLPVPPAKASMTLAGRQALSVMLASETRAR